MFRTIFFAALAVTGISAAPAYADSAADAPSSSAQTTAGQGDSLSSKLSRSGGVIAPNTNVDPGIKVPAPDPQPGTTPVIPPAATGGNSAK